MSSMKTTDSIARERAARYPATAGAVSPVDLREGVRNPGMPLELDWIREIRVNRSAVERRAATLGTRRSVKKEWQAAWLRSLETPAKHVFVPTAFMFSPRSMTSL